MSEAAKETYLFVLLKDQSLPLGVDGQRQRKICLAHILVLLQQTTTNNHTDPKKDIVYMSSYFSEIVRGVLLACNTTPPTCVSSPARPFASFCGCTRPCSSHSASPGSLPLGPACVSSPACSSAAGSQSELHPPLMDATRTGRYWVTEWLVFIIIEKNGDVQMLTEGAKIRE